MNRARLITLVGLSLVASQSACEQRELPTCDITQRACQESIYYRVLNLRNDGYDPFGGLPPVGVITEDEFRAMLEREQAASQPQGPTDPWDRALALLQFTSSTADGGSSSIDDQVTHIYAYYDPQTKAVTIVSHPNQTGDYQREEAMVTLAHELVHAVQDRELNLQRRDFHTSDEYLAYNGTIEGDARFYEYLFTEDVRRMLRLTPRDPLLMADQELQYAYDNFEKLGSPFFAARYLLYPLGAKYETTAYQSGGNAAVRHAYAKAPIRTVGLLVGPDGRSPPVGTGAVCPAPTASELPADGDNPQADQFGALLFYSFLRGWGVDHATAFPTAQSWTGDYLRVQANADVSTTAVAWRLEFSADLPTTIAPVLTASGVLSAIPGTRSLEITASDSPTPLDFRPANCR